MKDTDNDHTSGAHAMLNSYLGGHSAVLSPYMALQRGGDFA